ncbi:glycosyltransferase family 4 protein [Leptothoe sp. ISB3NOV94-8A]
MSHTAALGGAELSLIDLIVPYRETSEVLILDYGPLEEKLKEKEVSVAVIPSKHLVSIKTSSQLAALRSIPELFRLARQVANKSRQGFDFIHVNTQKSLVITALASLMGGTPPIIWHLRDILTAKHFSALNRQIAVMLANRCITRVIANSQATASAFIKAGGKPSLVEVVYNGIASEPFDLLPIDQSEQVRKALGIEEVPVIGVFSRLSFWKGQHIVLHALKELPEFHVLLVGDALFGETEYVEYLHSLIQDLGLEEHVHWLGFRQDIPALMQACDYIVHPSTEPEPFGRVLVEGLLAQKPVIAAAAGGALEIIQDGITGKLFPPGDAKALAETIKTLNSNPEQIKYFRQQGYAQARKKFSLAESLKTFAFHLEKLSEVNL